MAVKVWMDVRKNGIFKKSILREEERNLCTKQRWHTIVEKWPTCVNFDYQAVNLLYSFFHRKLVPLMWKSEFFFEYINERIIFFRDNVCITVLHSVFCFHSFVCETWCKKKEMKKNWLNTKNIRPKIREKKRMQKLKIRHKVEIVALDEPNDG